MTAFPFVELSRRYGAILVYSEHTDQKQASQGWIYTAVSPTGPRPPKNPSYAPPRQPSSQVFGARSNTATYSVAPSPSPACCPNSCLSSCRMFHTRSCRHGRCMRFVSGPPSHFCCTWCLCSGGFSTPSGHIYRSNQIRSPGVCTTSVIRR
jgi:hypothetical protein